MSVHMNTQAQIHMYTHAKTQNGKNKETNVK